MKTRVRLFRAVCWLAWAALVGCKSVDTQPTPSLAGSPSTQATTNAPALTKVKYNAALDKEFEEIFELAKKNYWEEAEFRASRLYEQYPNDGAVARIYDWVSKQRELLRARAVEDKIREIDSKHSVFNPSLGDLLTEQKDRGLPPRKDVRDVVQDIEAQPYIPKNYGKVVRRQGPLFDLESPRGRMSQVLTNKVTLHLDNVTLEQLILHVSQAAGINFIADKSIAGLKQVLSVHMDSVTLDDLLRYLARNAQIQFQVGDEMVWVVDGKDPKNLLEETRFYRLRYGFVTPAQFGATEITRTTTVTPQKVTTTVETEKVKRFVNDGASPMPSIEQAIKQFFKGSNYYIDYERNLIVAQGTREQLAVMDEIVREFDRPLQQVLIEARFITVTRGAFLQLGALWETGRSPITGDQKGVDFTGLLSGLGVSTGLGLQETFTNILGRANLSATLTALEQSGESQTLSAPRVTLVNNLPAVISDGKVQYYYQEYTVSQQVVAQAGVSSTLVPKGTPTQLQSGVKLEVMASIGGDGKSILLALHPEVNSEVKLVDFATVQGTDAAGNIIDKFTIRLPESRTQDIATRVVIKSGQTVVMGGVLERDQRTYVESVPVLGNIPIIGAAFRRRTEIDKPRYLLVFVTATIINENGELVVAEES